MTAALQQLREDAARLHQAGRLAEAAAAHRRVLALAPADFESSHMLGTIQLQLGKSEEGLRLLDDAVASDPHKPQAWLHHGLAQHRLGRLAGAAQSYERALQLRPDYPEALFNLGLVLRDAGRPQEALAQFTRVIALEPRQASAFFNRGNLLFASGDNAGAVADYESALALRPDHADSWLNRGNALVQLGHAQQALDSFDRALALAPQRGDIWYNRGVVLHGLERLDEALAAYDKALALAPDLADAWNNRGGALQRIGQMDEALASHERAIALDPRHVQARVNIGVIQSGRRAFAAALESYERALSLAPDFADGWHNRGNALRDTGRMEEALASFDRALALDPRHAVALCNRAGIFLMMKRHSEALAEFKRLAVIDPTHKYLLGGLLIAAREMCDWPMLDALRPRFESEVAGGRSIVPPLAVLGYCDDAALAHAAARHYLRDILPVMPAAQSPAPGRNGKIRLAYVSGDLHTHATAHLTAGLFEAHDRDRFEVIGISFGPDEDSAMQRRLRTAFDQFHEVRDLSDGEVAARMRAMEIDIAIDLKGYTQGARIGIFAHRPAPVQVNYLGYPGTLAAGFIDYVIADGTVLPKDQQAFYDERIVHLPDCYQSNDPSRPLPPPPPRAAAGLPDNGFVFCCFNSHNKIARSMFEIWMRLLAAVPDSVLWLMDGSGRAALCREAAARNIDPARLIFAPMLDQDGHLARHAHAGLALDTLPYNAHTTASDALWMGVPLVTMTGKAFAGRVAASLLSAAGLPELITGDLESYEALALSLARDADRLAKLRSKLESGRQSAPLFDITRFTRNIEAAYIGMMETRAAQLTPRRLFQFYRLALKPAEMTRPSGLETKELKPLPPPARLPPEPL